MQFALLSIAMIVALGLVAAVASWLEPEQSAGDGCAERPAAASSCAGCSGRTDCKLAELKERSRSSAGSPADEDEE